MNRMLQLMLAMLPLFLCAEFSAAQTKTVTDMTGRNVTVPSSAKRIVSLSNNTTVYLFTLCPDRLLGWSFAPKPESKKIIGDFFSLPNLGSAAMKSSNFEEILKLEPDLVVCSDEDEVFNPDELQAKLKVPVVKVATELVLTDKVYEFLGECTGQKKRAGELAAYAARVIRNVKDTVSKIPSSKKIRVYYAEGIGGLQTDVTGNVHTEVFDLTGVVNVADMSEERTGSMVTVSMEQVLKWDPELIIAGISRQGDFYSSVFGDHQWSNIKAVKTKRIYRMPSLPFNWLDRPPSPARLLALYWLGNLAYPDYFKKDMVKETKYFYELFYRYKLTDNEVDDILKDSK
jgi:iron complex transport system substrate-binding protein